MREQKTDRTPLLQIIIVGVLGAVLSLIGIVSGLTLLMIVLPIPYIQLIYKHGHTAGRQAVLVTTVINSLFLGMTGVVVTLISFGLIAVVLGGAFHEKYTPKTTARISVAASIVSALLLYFFSVRMGYLNEMKVVLGTNPFWNTLLGAGVDPKMKQEIINYIMAVLPGMFVGMALLLGVVNYYLAAFYLKRQGHQIPQLKPFRHWRFPRWVGFLYLLLWFMLEIALPDLVTINLLVIFMTVLIGEGIAFILYYTERWGIPSWIRFLVLIFGVPFLSVVYLILGLIDNVFQLRGFRKRKQT